MTSLITEKLPQIGKMCVFALYVSILNRSSFKVGIWLILHGSIANAGCTSSYVDRLKSLGTRSTNMADDYKLKVGSGRRVDFEDSLAQVCQLGSFVVLGKFRCTRMHQVFSNLSRWTSGKRHFLMVHLKEEFYVAQPNRVRGSSIIQKKSYLSKVVCIWIKASSRRPDMMNYQNFLDVQSFTKVLLVNYCKLDVKETKLQLQCLQQTAEYVALSACCAQVMWFEEQLQDFMASTTTKYRCTWYSQSAIAIAYKPCTTIRKQSTSILLTVYGKALPEDRFKYLSEGVVMSEMFDSR
ncbi:hypothetical protein Tco_0077516 [Tanacetum coccineum]